MKFNVEQKNRWNNIQNRLQSFQETHRWSSQLESFIHASFYIGYVLGHVPGGYLAEKFGGKIVLNVGLFLTAFFTIITPVAIESGETLKYK